MRQLIISRKLSNEYHSSLSMLISWRPLLLHSLKSGGHRSLVMCRLQLLSRQQEEQGKKHSVKGQEPMPPFMIWSSCRRNWQSPDGRAWSRAKTQEILSGPLSEWLIFFLDMMMGQ